MGLLNIIRRMALREKQSIREISRRTGLSRNTIAKYLSAGTIEPTFTVPERPSKLDPFADKLAGWLKTEAGRSRKQRRTLKQLHADPVALGFTGSYGRIDLAPKFYPVLSSLRRFCVAVLGAVAAGCGAAPFRLRSTASRRGLMV